MGNIENTITADTITADQFKDLVEKQPDWADTLTDPVRVVGRVVLEHSRISHLSPMLTFDRDGGMESPKLRCKFELRTGTHNWAAIFANCKDLKTVTGKFLGPVSFDRCGIEDIDIDGLVIDPSPGDEISAVFHACEKLKVGQGNFPKRVRFTNCPNLKEIRNIQLQKLTPRDFPNPPVRLIVSHCDRLRRVPQWILDDEYPETISLPRKAREIIMKSIKARKYLKSYQIEL